MFQRSKRRPPETPRPAITCAAAHAWDVPRPPKMENLLRRVWYTPENGSSAIHVTCRKVCVHLKWLWILRTRWANLRTLLVHQIATTWKDRPVDLNNQHTVVKQHV